jgi:hypothetical protein
MRKAVLGALLLTALCASPSLASTIDFRKQIWNPNGAGSKTVGDVTVTANPYGSKLFWSTEDGFGIDSDPGDREDDEINNNERLVITFTRPFQLTGVLITDLFRETLDGITYNEIGEFRINGGEWEAFSGVETRRQNPNGEVFFSPPGIEDVWKLEFRADTFDFGGRRNDFSVALLEGSPSVPEPTSLMLMGTGLIGLATRIRRKRASSSI